MSKRAVRIEMECDSTTLNTEGGIHLSPFRSGRPAKVRGVRVRRVLGAEVALEPRRYEYRFDAQDDQGKFKLVARYAATSEEIAREEFDTAVAMNGLQFRFKVEAAR